MQKSSRDEGCKCVCVLLVVADTLLSGTPLHPHGGGEQPGRLAILLHDETGCNLALRHTCTTTKNNQFNHSGNRNSRGKCTNTGKFTQWLAHGATVLLLLVRSRP